MSDYYRGRPPKKYKSYDGYLDDYFSEEELKYYPLKEYHVPYKPKDVTIKKDAEVYFSDKVQKFILENIKNSLEWYIFGYGTVETHPDHLVFHVEEYSLPLQKRASGSVEVDQAMKAVEHYEMCQRFPDLQYVGLIHSHHTMSAYFSTDDKEDIDDFKELCSEGFSIVFSAPKKKYTKAIKYDAITIASLDFDAKVWEEKKFFDGEIVLFYDFVDLDYSTNELLETNDLEIEENKVNKRVLKCRKLLNKVLETEHLDKLNRRQLEALLWAVGMDEAERNNLALILKTATWKEESEIEEEDDDDEE